MVVHILSYGEEIGGSESKTTRRQAISGLFSYERSPEGMVVQSQKGLLIFKIYVLYRGYTIKYHDSETIERRGAGLYESARVRNLQKSL